MLNKSNNTQMKNLIEIKTNYYNEFLETRLKKSQYEVEWIVDGVLKTEFFDTKKEAIIFLKNL